MPVGSGRRGQGWYIGLRGGARVDEWGALSPNTGTFPPPLIIVVRRLTLTTSNPTLASPSPPLVIQAVCQRRTQRAPGREDEVVYRNQSAVERVVAPCVQHQQLLRKVRSGTALKG